MFFNNCGRGKKTGDELWGTNRGCSSVGRAVALQAIGQEFEPPQLHQSGLHQSRRLGGKGSDRGGDCEGPLLGEKGEKRAGAGSAMGV
jgi:hypothetical protein